MRPEPPPPVHVTAAPTAPLPATSPTAFALLVRVNALQAWRKLLALREQSLLMTGFIGLFTLGYVVLSFGLFFHGLKFIGTFPGLGALLIERLLFLLFAFLFVLLLFSNLVISYTNLFRNRETVFLLALPIRSETIFRWKFLESTALASWAFVFLVAPLLVAYGLRQGVPWHFYPATVGLIVLFLLLPAMAGAAIAILLARHLDRRGFQILALAVMLLLLLFSVVWLKPEPIPDDIADTRVLVVLDRLLSKTSFAHFPFLPSYWLSSGVLHWAEGALATALFFVLVLVSHVLFFGALSFTSLGRSFYSAASAVHSRGSIWIRWSWFQARQRRGRDFAFELGAVEAVVNRLRWVRPDVCAVMVKDIRMFWRDTTQWGQSLVLFGLLGAYILNLRHFTQQLANPFWVNLVSLLNLLACSLNLATITTRFVFPQFSQEGKRCWIVGMAPLGLVRVVKTKFWLAGIAAWMLTLGLILLSCHMLKLPWDRTAFFAGAVTVMSFSLTGLAVGLGALYPNFKEDNPGKIVSGFGGTFCLVLSFLYIVAAVTLVGLSTPWGRWAGGHLSHWAGVSGVAFLVLSLLLGGLPLHLGLRKVAHFEIS